MRDADEGLCHAKMKIDLMEADRIVNTWTMVFLDALKQKKADAAAPTFYS